MHLLGIVGVTIALGAGSALNPTLAATYHVDPHGDNAGPGTAQQPWLTIQKAASSVAAGDTVWIHGGTYRESVVVEASGTAERPIRFEALPGEHVIVTGADLLTDWRPEPDGSGVHCTPWPHRFIAWNRAGTHPDDDYHAMIGRCEQVFIQGYPLLQVLKREQLARGTFFVDLEAKRLYVCPRDGAELTRSRQRVEASSRDEVWRCRGANVQVRGIRFRYAASRAQHGGAVIEGAQGVVEDCVFESMNSCGATFQAADLVVRRCVFQGNGQLGFGASRAHNLLFTGCTVRGNNVKGFDRGWEAGGNKLALCRGAVLEHSQFLDNHGNGIWFDIGNEACVVRNCLIAGNDDAGIFYEISYGLHAHDNVIMRNGLAETPGAWGAAAGIALSSSPGCVVERNVLLGNREGLSFREQTRTTPSIDEKAERPVWNHDQRIEHNLFAYNRDSQIGGWFDIDDERHWPRAMQETPGRDQSLETLHIAFRDNLYAPRAGQPLVVWGTAWKRHETYQDLATLEAALGLGQGSQLVDWTAEDLPAGDLRVRPDNPAATLGCYPQGDVPGVSVGVIQRP